MSKPDKLLNLLFIFLFQLLIMAYEVRLNRGTIFWMVYEPQIHDTLLPIRFMTILTPLFLTVLIGVVGEFAAFIKREKEKEKIYAESLL